MLCLVNMSCVNKCLHWLLPANSLYHLHQNDLVNTIGEAVALGTSGVVIWDSISIAQRVQVKSWYMK